MYVDMHVCLHTKTSVNESMSKSLNVYSILQQAYIMIIQENIFSSILKDTIAATLEDAKVWDYNPGND